jgi:hypothetical protein
MASDQIALETNQTIRDLVVPPGPMPGDAVSRRRAVLSPSFPWRFHHNPLYNTTVS